MKDYLIEWADAENRTVSNLVETLIGEAIAARQANQNGTPAAPVAGGKAKRGKGGEE